MVPFDGSTLTHCEKYVTVLSRIGHFINGKPLAQVNSKIITLMKTPKRFIVIDDDPVNTILCSIIIKKALSKLDVQIFHDAETGLRYIKNEYAKNDNHLSTVLFLDI